MAWMLPVVVLLVLFAPSAAALSYCLKASGIATREVVYAETAALRTLVGRRIARGDNYLMVVNVPAEVQRKDQYRSVQAAELLKSEQFEELAQETFEAANEALVRDGGSPNSYEQHRLQLARYLSDTNNNPPDPDPTAFAYVYSGSREMLEGFVTGEGFVHAHGVTLEGTAREVSRLLTPNESHVEDLAWWQSAFDAGYRTIITVGFDLPADVRALAPRETQVLRIRDYASATNPGLGGLDRLLDVDPAHASVINFFPKEAREASPWGFDEAKAQAYAHEGRRFTADQEALGYTVVQNARVPAADAIALLKSSLANNRSVLVFAESSRQEDGSMALRLPGVQEVLGADSFRQLGSDVERLLLVTCNAQAFSPLLPLAIVGTIYTNAARSLVKLTFSAAQRPTMDEYIDIGAQGTLGWARSVVATASELISRGFAEIPGEESGRIRVATVYRIVGAADPIGDGLPATNGDSPVSNEDVPPAPSGASMFALGCFGALCREAMRWSRLLKRRRAVAYANVAFFLVSLLLTACAGGVAYVFTRAIANHATASVVAFVAGCGFEKIVQMSARLRFWQPAVPMGRGASDSAPAGRKARGSVLEFLRHGDDP